MTPKFTGSKELREWLVGQGFSISQNYLNSAGNECNWLAHKRSTIPARACECNGNKGMQIVAFPYESVINDVVYLGCEIEVCGEINGLWWKLRCYGARGDEVKERLPEIERMAIDAWNALGHHMVDK